MNKKNVIAYVCSGVAICVAVVLIFVFVGFSGGAKSTPSSKTTEVSSSAPGSLPGSASASAAPTVSGVSTVVTPAMTGTDYEGKAITFPSLSIDYPHGWTIVENTFSSDPFSKGRQAELVFQNEDGLQLALNLELGFDGYGVLAEKNTWEMLTDTGLEGIYLITVNRASSGTHIPDLALIPGYEKEKGGSNYPAGPGMIDDGSRQNKVLGASIRRPTLNGDSRHVSLEEANVSNEDLAQIEAIVASLRKS